MSLEPEQRLELREQGGWFDKAACILLVNRWLKAIQALLNADASCVVLNDRYAARVISRINIPHAFVATRTTVKAAPYRADETVVARDATGRPELHAFLGALALPRTGFFYRRPLSIAGERVLSLVAFGETPQPELSERELLLADEIAERMAEELERYYPADTGSLSASMEMSRTEIDCWLETADMPGAMFDSGLVLRSANERMRSLFPIDWERTIGLPLAEIKAPGTGSIAFLFRQAIELRCSTPRMDVAVEGCDVAGSPTMVRLHGSPIAPIDGEPVLIATVDPARTAAGPRRAVLHEGEPVGQEATAAFLLETLVQRRALRSRNDVSFVTLRCWRQSIRAHQISALRAIKRNAPASIAAEIAAEMGDDIRSLFGAGNFRAVVPMPCGNSGSERCLSVLIAQALARDLGLPVAHALALHPASGSSHPKTNLKRPPMRLVTPVDGPVLLIDDVATSGRHIEEATRLLRSTGASVLALAWLGGDSEKG
jgi:predicted amidophosphoribosyltransferase